MTEFLRLQVRVDGGARTRKFVHLSHAMISIADLCQEIALRYRKIYAEDISVIGLRDEQDCDFDPDYLTSYVLGNGSVVKVLTERDGRDRDGREDREDREDRDGREDRQAGSGHDRKTGSQSRRRTLDAQHSMVDDVRSNPRLSLPPVPSSDTNTEPFKSSPATALTSLEPDKDKLIDKLRDASGEVRNSKNTSTASTKPPAKRGRPRKNPEKTGPGNPGKTGPGNPEKTGPGNPGKTGPGPKDEAPSVKRRRVGLASAVPEPDSIETTQADAVEVEVPRTQGPVTPVPDRTGAGRGSGGTLNAVPGFGLKPASLDEAPDKAVPEIADSNGLRGTGVSGNRRGRKKGSKNKPKPADGPSGLKPARSRPDDEYAVPPSSPPVPGA